MTTRDTNNTALTADRADTNATNQNYKLSPAGVPLCKKNAPSLCWSCALATGAPCGAEHITCPWAARYKPVAGWTARLNTFKGEHEETIESYYVEACPLYLADLEQQIKDLDNATLAAWLGFKESTARVHNDICCKLLYYYIYYRKKYERMIAAKEAGTTAKAVETKEILSESHLDTELGRQSERKQYRLSFALAQTLPTEPEEVDKKVRNLALRHLEKELKIEYDIDPRLYNKHMLDEVKALENAVWHEKVQEKLIETARIKEENRIEREARKAALAAQKEQKEKAERAARKNNGDPRKKPSVKLISNLPKRPPKKPKQNQFK